MSDNPLPNQEVHSSSSFEAPIRPRAQGLSDRPTQPEPTVSTFTFLGTGTSSQVPAIGCLTDPRSRCKICPSALHASTQKNRRRNTSAFVELSNQKTILIDCGKSFFDTALQIWPRAGFRQIDALLLTHAHADAILGLDDLRGWTLGGFIQKSISVYLTQKTFDAVAQMFPYMVDSAKATGGGDIPAFCWNIIDEDSRFWIESCGVGVQTLKVEHGNYFDEAMTPFICLGFQIGRPENQDKGGVSYISDASRIPEATRRRLEGSQLLVLDALRRGRHASHMSIGETVEFIRNLDEGADRIYLVDFTHEIDHYAFERELSDTMNGDVRPAYDGMMVKFDEGLTEVDLLGDKAWIAVSERDAGPTKGKSEDRSEGKVQTLV